MNIYFEVVVLLDYDQFYCLPATVAGDGDIIDAVGWEMAIIGVVRERLGGGVLLDDTTDGIDDADVDDVVVGLGEAEGVAAGGGVGGN